MVRLATRGSISSCKEDASTGRCRDERPRSHRYAAFSVLDRTSRRSRRGERLHRLCFRRAFSKAENFQESFAFGFLFFAFCFLLFAIFRFSSFLIFHFLEIMFSSRSI